MEFAVPGVPGTPISDTAGLTQDEALSLFDLASYWSTTDKTEGMDEEY